MDREKVISNLQVVYEYLRHFENTAKMGEWVSDALTLLKEQEVKAGTWQWKIHGKAESGGTLGEAVCDQCGKSTYATAVKGDLNYCPNCGANMTDRR